MAYIVPMHVKPKFTYLLTYLLVNSFVYKARQTWEIYQVLPYSVDFKAPGEQSLVNIVWFRIEDL